jgi:hypothetical protein
MKTENDCRCDKRINQLEEALRNIANGDMRTSRAKAKMALEGTFPPVDEKPEQEAKSHGNVYAVHDASCKTVAHFAVNNPADQHHKNDQHGKENSGFYFKGYWYQEYLKMREKYWERIGENSKQADRIRELEEQLKVKEFLLNQAIKDLETEQAKNRKLEDQLKVKQRESRELYAMLGHIVDWSPELPFYMKDEYKTLFRNALAAARELLSKCSVKEGK